MPNVAVAAAGAVLAAEIEFLDVLMLRNLVGLPLVDDAAAFQYVDKGGDAQRGGGVLAGAATASPEAGAGTASLANAYPPPYSIAAAKVTTSRRWSTPQRMGKPEGRGEQHYM